MAGRKFWQLLAGLWFVLTGLLVVTNLQIQGAGVVLGFLAIIVGLLLFADR